MILTIFKARVQISEDDTVSINFNTELNILFYILWQVVQLLLVIALTHQVMTLYDCALLVMFIFISL